LQLLTIFGELAWVGAERTVLFGGQNIKIYYFAARRYTIAVLGPGGAKGRWLHLARIVMILLLFYIYMYDLSPGSTL
jgi:hypothetical protein